MRRISAGSSLAIAMACSPSLAMAQEAALDAAARRSEAPANGAQRYTPSDFASFSPRTALDMVEKVPGFLIVTGTNGGERGLGAATENVLINGERIANKSTDARSALQRIAASQVAYVDIVDGAEPERSRADRARSPMSFWSRVRRRPDLRQRSAGNPIGAHGSTTIG